MIGIDIIRKKRKTEGSGSSSGNVTGNGISVSSGGDVQNAMHADEADHANRADEATHAASAKEIDGGSSVWNTIRTWINNATGALTDIFLRKDQDDSTEHKLTMGAAEVKGSSALDGGLTVGTGKNLEGTAYGIDKDGVATLAKLVAEYLQSPDYSKGKGQGFDGTGYGLTKDAKGKYTLEIDNLVARMKMIVAELEVHEMSFIGGTVVMSACGNRVARVEAIDGDGSCIAAAYETQPTLVIPEGKVADKFRCYFLATDGSQSVKNEWTVGQLARCKTNNIAKPGDYTNYENREYWRLVVGVSKAPVTVEGKSYHYIELSNSTSKDIALTDAAGTERHVTLGGVCEMMASLPYAGDNIVGMGHCWDTAKQNVAILSVMSLGWSIYQGIDNYDLPEANIVNKFGIDKSIVATDRLILRPYAAPKESQTVAVVRGAYSDDTYYGHNDMTTLDGQLWIGAGIEIGKTIKGEKPSATSPYWSLAAARGIQGEQGDSYSIVSLLNNIPVDSLNLDDVKASEGSVLEADFYNNGVAANVANASITCYDQGGNVLGSPITSTNTDNIVVDGGALYLSKDCKYITVVAKDKDGKLLVSKSIGIVRNGVDATELVSLILYLSDGAYTWRQGQGKIATIAAAVTMGNYDITDAQDASQFIWTRESESAQGDKDWNSQHKFGAKTLEVSEGDMFGDITSFVCTLHKATGEVYTMAKKDFTL